jgi:predicted GH43/DUF377 family glycosyl hydrolase
MFVRHPHNPLITPSAVKPSRPDFEVTGTFNAGATIFNGEVILLVRVAERPVSWQDGWIQCPYYKSQGELTIRRVACNDPDWDTSDPRKVQQRATGDLLLTSVSHLRLARSRDGIHFDVADQPWLTPASPYEVFGVEDPRITRIGDTYYVNYTAVSPHGIATALVSTPDFVQIARHGIIFPPDNRDVTLFPEPINGMYICYHRPMPGMFMRMNIWMATSPDLRHWGDSRLVLASQPGHWDAGRVGGGAPPILTECGWLSIYHGADEQDRYCLGAFLTPYDDPGRIIARSTDAILRPRAPYEVDGFFSDVVFTCGAVVVDGKVRLYYGAADESLAMADAPLSELLDSLDVR